MARIHRIFFQPRICLGAALLIGGAFLAAGCSHTNGAGLTASDLGHKVASAFDTTPLNHLHIAVIDTSLSTQTGEEARETMVRHAVDAAKLDGKITHALLLNWWTKSFNLTGDKCSNQDDFEEAIGKIKEEKGQYTALETVLKRIQDVVEKKHKENPNMTYSVTLGTTATDAKDENMDKVKSEAISQYFVDNNIKINFLVHDVKGQEGAINRIQAALSPLGTRAIVCSPEDFDKALEAFWKNVDGDLANPTPPVPTSLRR